MSKKLPKLTASEIIKVLEKRGFVQTRQSDSHEIFKNENGVRATFPYHSVKIIHPKTLKRIFREANLSVEELNKLLK